MGTLTAGIKEIFSSAKTTGSNVMLCGNDGTPDGHITMANLANVLGVGSLIAHDVDFYHATDDLNDITRFNKFPCLYASRISPNTTNSPGVEGFLLGYAVNVSGMGFQLIFSYWNSDGIYFRSHHNSGWNGWKKITAEAIS